MFLDIIYLMSLQPQLINYSSFKILDCVYLYYVGILLKLDNCKLLKKNLFLVSNGMENKERKHMKVFSNNGVIILVQVVNIYLRVVFFFFKTYHIIIRGFKALIGKHTFSQSKFPKIFFFFFPFLK